MASSISAFKAAGADLLVGVMVYPCDHRFGYIIDHTLDRADGERAAQARVCPKCAEGEEGKCLVCLQPWDANATASCPTCETFFFDGGLLEERCAQLEALGLKLAKDSKEYGAGRRAELERKAVRKERLLALSAARRRQEEEEEDA